MDEEFTARVEQLASSLLTLHIGIDFDPGALIWEVEIDQGLGYEPSRIKVRDAPLARALNEALTKAGV